MRNGGATMGNKYGARKVQAPNGQLFDSKKEYQRYFELKILERAGRITGLERQVKYVLIPTQRDKCGKVIEKECSYYADFVYFDCALCEKVVEDVKGVRTDAYKIKKKLLLYVHGIRIKET